MSPTLLRALNNPIRRESLRQLHQGDDPRSANQLSGAMNASLGRISYHLTVLAGQGVIRPVEERRVRGATEKFFVSQVSDHRQVIAILAETEADDDGLRG